MKQKQQRKKVLHEKNVSTEWLKLNELQLGGLKDSVTHLKAAIYESDVGAGEVKASLDLGNGALHVGSCQGLGEAGKGECHDK